MPKPRNGSHDRKAPGAFGGSRQSGRRNKLARSSKDRDIEPQQTPEIRENSFAAIQGCVEDLHNLELAVKIGEPRSKVNQHAQHAMWNLACSFKGLQQAHSEPALLTQPGRLILNSYLGKTVRLGALLLEIHGYGVWANSWREVLEGGHINTIDFDPLKPPSETNVRDTRLCAILGPLSTTPRSSLPFGVAAGATPTIIPACEGRIPDWTAKALKENPKLREMYEKLNAGAADPGSTVDEGSFNMG
ncbi:MAG: hypothetical protein M1839_008297 [Geoglossum umbratile]|nr:MAG: hypothetical protein M1839_008297 [Geoglossum umbratile]